MAKVFIYLRDLTKHSDFYSVLKFQHEFFLETFENYILIRLLFCLKQK